MSMESLSRAFTDATQSFSDTYVKFENECNTVVRFIKTMVTGKATSFL